VSDRKTYHEPAKPSPSPHRVPANDSVPTQDSNYGEEIEKMEAPFSWPPPRDEDEDDHK